MTSQQVQSSTSSSEQSPLSSSAAITLDFLPVLKELVAIFRSEERNNIGINTTEVLPQSESKVGGTNFLNSFL